MPLTLLLPAGLSWLQLLAALASAVLLPLVLHRIFFHAKPARHSSSAGSETLDDYITKHGMSERDAKFQVAVDFIASKAGKRLTNEQRLMLYAFYKQALFGACSAEKPSAADFVGSAKWESWKALGAMDSDVAKQQYLAWVQDLFEDFDVTGSRRRSFSSDAGSGKASREELSLGGSFSTAGVVSTPTVDMTSDEWQITEDPFHFASTGDLDKVTRALEGGFDVDSQDDGGRTMLHWAVDRSQSRVAKLLLKRNASPNAQDGDGMTALHYATSCEDEALVQLLVNHGASPDIEDNDGETPLAYAATDELTAILSAASKSQEE
ncbi:hypothetical protein PybrP1_011843 [[Pythium] brassicae (nom. inval.)]|nr:hypothetical protein PybrP1_011843 [[Pythium] brassicae (nom. inval.)]